VVGIVILAGVAYTGYAGKVGSDLLLYGDVKDWCATPAVFGWDYEAINYDLADDARLAASWTSVAGSPFQKACPNQGMEPGDEVVTADGIRLDGWYIPSGDGDAATDPTVVLVHGWASNKSDLLRYARVLHEDLNLVLYDQRHSGRSTGDHSTMNGIEEAQDLRAMIDWLERTKHPRAIGVLGDSGGAATAAMLTPTEPRIAAVVLDSVHARWSDPSVELAAREGYIAPLTVLGTQVGVWLRVGVNLDDGNPVSNVPRFGDRPVLFLHGTADVDDLPGKTLADNVRAALGAGLDVEVRMCEGGTHGKTVDHCADRYRDWVVGFFERTIGA
jgi:pimeloyl-ACP methyl ester carboxylesterase